MEINIKSLLAYIFLLGICLNLNIYANSNTQISGKITNEDGKPIIGASIRIANSTLGSITNKNGKFSIKKVDKENINLIITAIGYETKIIKLEEFKEDIQITLIESPLSFDGVVVTGTRNDKIYQDSPVKVSVLDKEVFSSTASVSLMEGLSFQPGLRIENNCQNCGFSQVRINGLEGRYSQILIDGIPSFSSLNGVYGLEQIPSNLVERIEVVRGSGSSLYGGSAIAGVINIITKDPLENNYNVRFQQSFIDGTTPDLTVQLNGSNISSEQNLGISYFANYRNRDHWDANGDEISEIAKLDVIAFGTSAFYKPTNKSRLSIDYNGVVDDRRGGNNFNLEPHQADIAEAIDHITHRGNIKYEQYLAGDNIKLSAYSSLQHTNRDSYYGAEQDPNAYGTTLNRTIVTGSQLTHVLGNMLGDHVITGGYEMRYEDTEDIAEGYNYELNQFVIEHGIYLQDDWSLSNTFSLVLGARLDFNNFIDEPIFNPRANLMYKPVDNLSFRGYFATGFRAPQAFDEDLHIETLGGDRLRIRLADDLREERSMSFGFSGEYTFKLNRIPLSISSEYFNTRLMDAFAFSEPVETESGELFKIKSNQDNARVQGITFELKAIINSKFDIISGITIQENLFDNAIEWSAQLPGTREFLRTPNEYGYITANWNPISDLDISVSSVFTGSMFVPHYLSEVEEGGTDRLVKSRTFFEINIRTSYEILNQPSLKLNLGIQNVLNQYQNDFDSGITRDAGYIYGPTRPMTIFVGFSANY